MKIIEKISLIIFSIIILVMSLINCLVAINWIKITTVSSVLETIVLNPTYTNALLIVSIILILLSIKCIFFPGDKSDKEGTVNGILLENESGRLIISVETIQNLVKGVIAGFPSAQLSNCRVILDKQTNNVQIAIRISVTQDTVIKDLSLNIQNRIKEVVKSSTDLDIKQIDIDVKDIIPNSEIKD